MKSALLENDGEKNFNCRSHWRLTPYSDKKPQYIFHQFITNICPTQHLHIFYCLFDNYIKRPSLNNIYLKCIHTQGKQKKTLLDSSSIHLSFFFLQSHTVSMPILFLFNILIYKYIHLISHSWFWLQPVIQHKQAQAGGGTETMQVEKKTKHMRLLIRENQNNTEDRNDKTIWKAGC